MRILLVDDNEDDLELAQRALRPFHLVWHVTAVASAAAACAELERRPFDAIVTDQFMPGADGASLLEHVRLTYPRTRRIFLHGNGDLVERLAGFCEHQLLKPLQATSLRDALSKLMYAQT